MSLMHLFGGANIILQVDADVFPCLQSLQEQLDSLEVWLVGHVQPWLGACEELYLAGVFFHHGIGHP